MCILKDDFSPVLHSEDENLQLFSKIVVFFCLSLLFSVYVLFGIILPDDKKNSQNLAKPMQFPHKSK